MKSVAFVVVLVSVFNVACTSIEYNPQNDELENSMLNSNSIQTQNNSDEYLIDDMSFNGDILQEKTNIPFEHELLEPITFK